MKCFVNTIAVILLFAFCCLSAAKGNAMEILRWLIALAVIILPTLQLFGAGVPKLQALKGRVLVRQGCVEKYRKPHGVKKSYNLFFNTSS